MTYFVVLPCYNEPKCVAALLARYAAVRDDFDLEFICVDNGSRNETPAALAAVLPQYPWSNSIWVKPSQGYGGGINKGL